MTNPTWSRRDKIDLSPPDGTAVSAVLAMQRRSLNGILWPAALDASGAKAFFLGAVLPDDTPVAIYDDASTPARLEVLFQASSWVTFSEALASRLREWPYLQIQVVTAAGAAANQTGTVIYGKTVEV